MKPRPTRMARPRNLSHGLTIAIAVAAVTLSGVPAHAAAGEKAATWTADLSGPTGTHQFGVSHDRGALTLAGDAPTPAAMHTTQREGAYTLPPRRLEQPVNRVTAAIAAETPAHTAVVVEVRGRRGTGPWSEWRRITPQAPATLEAPSDQVQVQVMLSADSGADKPRVSRVALSADRTATAPARRAAAPLTATVFATREGLVGGQTANGHIITDSDHFVALPSPRALNADDSTKDYQVKICYGPTGKCETAPVFDVGPWNTHDDYWNPSDQRESWQDLPQGKPEAQAAFQDGYNGGVDETGRQVGNPAGIDLADGTFLDGLGMSDNDWVQVTYLWTGTP